MHMPCVGHFCQATEYLRKYDKESFSLWSRDSTAVVLKHQGRVCLRKGFHTHA